MSDDDAWDKLKKKLDFTNRYYGRKGEPLTMEQWGAALEDIDYRRVGYDEIPATHKYPPSYLSTVWLGLDHSWFMQGPPVLFETMRFEQEANEQSDWLPDRKYHKALEFPDPDPPHEYTEQVRYCTEEQASIGHKTIMRLIQEWEMT